MNIFNRNSIANTFNYSIHFIKITKIGLYAILCLSLLLAIFQHSLTASTIISKDKLPYHLTQYDIDQSGLKLTITLDPCKNEKCDVFLCLVKNDRIMDKQKLGWPLLDYQADRNSVSSSSISIDESNSNDGFPLTLSTGDHGANYIDIESRIVNVKNGTFSIFIAQRGGFESIGENYELFIVEHGRLKKTFQYSATTGIQQISDFTIEDIDNDGYENIVVAVEWHIAEIPEVGGDSKHFEIYPPPQNVKFYAIILATATSIDELIEIQSELEKKYPCLQYDTLILSTSHYELLEPNLFFMGDIEISKEHAQNSLKKYKDCADIRGAYIKRAK